MNRKEKFRSLKKTAIEISSPKGALLPAVIDAKEYALARATEINALQRELQQSKYAVTRRAFQTLPRHMRRRAASYNIKRLPIRLRLRAIDELKNDPHKGPSNKNKKNCRRWRRRPRNIQENPPAAWLATHLWHAKRCKMVDYWGRRVALKLNEKCLRSSIKAGTEGVLLHDASYWTAFDWKDFLELTNVKQFDSVLMADSVLYGPVIKVANWLFIHPAAMTCIPNDWVPLKDISLFMIQGQKCGEWLKKTNRPFYGSNGTHFIISQSPEEARSLWPKLTRTAPAKVCGLEVIERLQLERLQPTFPRDYPHTEAFKQWTHLQSNALQTQHSRKPPAKRPKTLITPCDWNLPTDVIAVGIKIEGKGTLSVGDEILDSDGHLIGRVTSAANSSLLLGCSIGIASVSDKQSLAHSLNPTTKVKRTIKPV